MIFLKWAKGGKGASTSGGSVYLLTTFPLIQMSLKRITPAN